MSLKQKKNKRLLTKSNHSTTTKGSIRGRRRLNHGIGKGLAKLDKKKKKK